MGPLKIAIASRNYSSWSLRAWLVLERTGAAYEEEVVPLRQPDTAAEIAKRSPSGRLPALRDGPLVVWDSLAIAEYLAERFPDAGLWPGDPGARATARSACAEMHAGFLSLRQALPMNIRLRRPDGLDTPGVQADVDRLVRIWGDVRRGWGGG